MRGSKLWLPLGVLLFLAWAISYFVLHVAGVLIHLLLVFALMSFSVFRVHWKRRSRIRFALPGRTRQNDGNGQKSGRARVWSY